MLACISFTLNMPVQHKMHICDWLKLLLNMYLSICNNTAYPFMLRWVLCVVNINNILFTLCACCCSNIAFCVCFTCNSFEILHFIVALFFLCVFIFLSLSFSVLCIQLTVSRNESTSCYDDISIFKGETKAISIRYARLIGSLFFIIKNIHEMKTIFIFFPFEFHIYIYCLVLRTNLMRSCCSISGVYSSVKGCCSLLRHILYDEIQQAYYYVISINICVWGNETGYGKWSHRSKTLAISICQNESSKGIFLFAYFFPIYRRIRDF